MKNLPPKLMLMNLSLVVFLAIGLQVSAASGVAQKVSISRTNASLITMFKDIRVQTGYDFLYEDILIDPSLRKTVNVDKVSIEAALDEVLSGSPLKYKISGKTIIIQSNTKSTNLINDQKLLSIQGIITDENGQPLSGINIVIKGTNSGTVSDDAGKFTLNAELGHTLIISSIGFVSQEYKISGNAVRILLKKSVNALDETIIIAYGTTSKRLSTGNIGSVKADEISRSPVSNPLLTLAGRVPGLFVNQNSGMPGGGITVRIQGTNSIGNGNDPLYIIDGVPFTSQQLPNFASQLGNSGGVPRRDQDIPFGNPFNTFNPADIESIEVLKDADATAIYGSKAANGAILITTKKGKSGKTSLDLNAQQGIGKVSNTLDLMDTKAYLKMRKEAYVNDGLEFPDVNTQKGSDNYDLTFWDTTRYTDWQKELIGKASKYSDIQSSISGGSGLTSFRISTGYHRETTVFPGDFSDSKLSFGLNLNHSSLNQRFKIQFSANYLNDNNKLPGIDLTSNAITLSPVAPNLYKEDGNLNWEKIISGPDSISTWVNPMATLQSKYQNITNNMTSHLQLNYRIAEGLDINGSLGYNYRDNKETVTNPITINAPELRSTSTRFTNFGRGNISSWIFEPQITYNKTLGKIKTSTLIGSTLQSNTADNLLLQGLGFSSDLIMKDIRSAPTLTVNSTLNSKYKYSGIYGRINLSYNDKYVVNLTGRRDGSSRFGPKNQYHNFGSIGYAWIFSNETLVKNNLSILSYGKLRGSYGITGNDQIGDYQFMNLLSAPVGIAVPYLGQSSLIPSGHYNPSLQWELTKKLQVGLDIGLLSDRLLIEITYIKNQSSNQLLYDNLPELTGFSSVLRNLPATVRNTAWEVSITSNNIKNKNIIWTSNINITIQKNKLISFNGLAASLYANTLTIGKPIGTVPLFSYAGVNEQTGNYQFYSADGSIVSTPSYTTDQLYHSNSSPTFYGGLQNDFKINNFKLNLLLQFAKQKGTNYIAGNHPGNFSTSAFYSNGNQPTYVNNRWQNSKENANIQKFSTYITESASYAQISNLAFTNASYIRLKNLSISWQFPRKWLKNVINSCSIFIHGQNLFTITSYKGLDPESRTIYNLPPLKIYTLGFQIAL